MLSVAIALLISTGAPSALGADRDTIAPPPVMVAVAAEYPVIATHAAVTGTVRISADLDDTGRPTRVTVIEGHPLLDSASLTAARRWRFAASTAERSRAVDIVFVYEMAPVDACTQDVLPRFVAPNQMILTHRKVVPPCQDCGPDKPIQYQVCE